MPIRLFLVADGQELELLSGTIPQAHVGGFLLAVSRLQVFIPALRASLNGKTASRLDIFKSYQGEGRMRVLAQAGEP